MLARTTHGSTARRLSFRWYSAAPSTTRGSKGNMCLDPGIGTRFRTRQRPSSPCIATQANVSFARHEKEDEKEQHGREILQPRQNQRFPSSCAHGLLQNKNNAHHSLLQPQQHRQSQIRLYHRTSQQPILPLIALVTTVVVVRYSYKALQRMEDEWDDYQHELAEYNARHGTNYKEGQDGTLQQVKLPWVWAVDIGSSKICLAHYPPTAGVGNSKEEKEGTGMPVVVEDVEGSRNTPAWLLFESSGEKEGTKTAPTLIGRRALAQLYQKQTSHDVYGQVVNPQRLLLLPNKGTTQQNVAQMGYRALVKSSLHHALEKTLDASSATGLKVLSADNQDTYSPIAFKKTDDSTETQPLQPVYTYPPSFHQDELQILQNAVSDLLLPPKDSTEPDEHHPHDPLFVPQPMAAILGADAHGLLPPTLPNVAGGGPIMVIDVGGAGIDLAIVNTNPETSTSSSDDPTATFMGQSIVHQTYLGNLGGDIMLTALANLVTRDFYKLPDITQVSDVMAVQQIYNAVQGAAMDLSAQAATSPNRARTTIHIPFLSMDFETKQPKHVNMDVAWNVVCQEVDAVVGRTLKHDNLGQVLSSNMPPPTSLSTLLSSAMMRAFESVSILPQGPYSLRAVLLVGGGARSPLFVQAVQDGLRTMAGDAFVTQEGGGRLVVPKGELVEECGVLGAALWGRVVSSAGGTS